MPRREFDLTSKDAAFVDACLAGDWNDADEVIQAALTLLRCHDFGEDGPTWAAYEHLLIDQADADIVANGVIEISDIEAYGREKLAKALAKAKSAA